MVLIEVKTKGGVSLVNPEQIESLSDSEDGVYLGIGGKWLMVPNTTVAEFVDYLRTVRPSFSRLFT